MRHFLIIPLRIIYKNNVEARGLFEKVWPSFEDFFSFVYSSFSQVCTILVSDRSLATPNSAWGLICLHLIGPIFGNLQRPAETELQFSQLGAVSNFCDMELGEWRAREEVWLECFSTHLWPGQTGLTSSKGLTVNFKDSISHIFWECDFEREHLSFC